MELFQGRFRFDNRERFFTKRIGRHWNYVVPRAVVMAASLLEFTICLNSALRNIVLILSGPLWSQELNSCVLEVNSVLPHISLCFGEVISFQNVSLSNSSDSFTISGKINFYFS